MTRFLIGLLSLTLLSSGCVRTRHFRYVEAQKECFSNPEVDPLPGVPGESRLWPSLDCRHTFYTVGYIEFDEDGKAIDRTFSTCWTPQMETIGRFGMSWAVLQKHLLPRRHETVLAGTAHVFPPGVLEPADLVTCDIRGHHLEFGVPEDVGPSGSVGYGGANVISVTLKVARHPDGSVDASCHTGDP